MNQPPRRSAAALILGVALLLATGCSEQPSAPAATQQEAAPATGSTGTGANLQTPPQAAPEAPGGASGKDADTGGGEAGAAGGSPAAGTAAAPEAKPGAAQAPAAAAEAAPQGKATAPAKPSSSPTEAPTKVTAPVKATAEPAAGAGSSGGSAAPAAPAKPVEPAKAEPAAVDASAKAQPLYKDNCLACHGDQLQGSVGPNLTKVGARKTKDQLVKQIQDGSGDMPGFKEALSAEEVETLATWLAAKK